MQKKSLAIIIISVLVAVGAAATFYYKSQSDLPAAAPIPPPPPTDASGDGANSSPQYPVDAPEKSGAENEADKTKAEAPGKPLNTKFISGDSDDTVDTILSSFIGKERLESLFFADDLVRRFVVMVNNGADTKLPSDSALAHPMEGDMRVSQGTDNLTLSSENFARYAAYIDLLKGMDERKLVDVYARHYPLFQKSYQDLGVRGYFNDRLVAFIDKTLAEQDPTPPITLVKDGYYKFTDPGLEALSFSKKALIRIGPENAALVKEKLKVLRQLITHLNKRG